MISLIRHISAFLRVPFFSEHPVQLCLKTQEEIGPDTVKQHITKYGRKFYDECKPSLIFIHFHQLTTTCTYGAELK